MEPKQASWMSVKVFVFFAGNLDHGVCAAKTKSGCSRTPHLEEQREAVRHVHADTPVSRRWACVVSGPRETPAREGRKKQTSPQATTKTTRWLARPREQTLDKQQSRRRRQQCCCSCVARTKPPAFLTRFHVRPESVGWQTFMQGCLSVPRPFRGRELAHDSTHVNNRVRKRNKTNQFRVHS